MVSFDSLVAAIRRRVADASQNTVRRAQTDVKKGLQQVKNRAAMSATRAAAAAAEEKEEREERVALALESQAVHLATLARSSEALATTSAALLGSFQAFATRFLEDVSFKMESPLLRH